MPPKLPVQHSERSDILDVLRGFALMGIIIANVGSFNGFIYLNDAFREQLFTHSSDKWLDYFEHAFVEGKFYSLFSLLFGIGFSIILIRNEQKGINPLKIFYRRLFVLMLFGIAHALLLWDGDILLLYSLIGMLLPLFRKCSDKTLLVWAAALILSPILIDVLKLILHWEPAAPIYDVAVKVDRLNGIPTDDSAAFYLYQPGRGYDAVLKWSQGGFFYRYHSLLQSNRIPKVLGMFLIGFYVGRKMIYARLEEYKRLLKKIQKWGFLIGIPAGLAYGYFEADGKNIPGNAIALFDTFFYAISVVPLSLAYTSSICLLWIHSKGKTIFRKLAPAGRMALTNYLMQSIFGIIIYYNLGFGLGVKFGPTISFLIALVVYLLQVAYSHLWFRYFTYGPFEWIWRQLTYGKRLPLVKGLRGEREKERKRDD